MQPNKQTPQVNETVEQTVARIKAIRDADPNWGKPAIVPVPKETGSGSNALVECLQSV